ncbi:hypothetical protein [Alkalilimnicola ehrlichii]|uniref:hypothetical protein n=1 Tax=Alkalilimnicola ehrlichii TaxID=351052 RepID=UPI0011C02B0D|nr:hypothetical protein [Alkalilimnicola ehrlichii]
MSRRQSGQAGRGALGVGHRLGGHQLRRHRVRRDDPPQYRHRDRGPGHRHPAHPGAGCTDRGHRRRSVGGDPRVHGARPGGLGHLHRTPTGGEPDPRELLPYDGVHTFELRRERLHREYRDGERGPVFVFFWYVWHLVTLWKIPFKISEWEYRQGRAQIPAAMAAWSEPVPPAQWAEPSALLRNVCAHLAALSQTEPSLDFMARYRKARAAAEQGPPPPPAKPAARKRRQRRTAAKE